MNYFSECAAASLWNGDELTSAATMDATDSASAPELQSAALSSLIEDKEIAAKAVAIVIGSSRRGVVALCAEMAELLKANRSLERQVSRLSAENKVLRSTSSSSSQPDVCNNSEHSGSGRTSGYHSRPAIAEVHAPADRPASNPSFLDGKADTAATGPSTPPPPQGKRRRHRSVQWPLPSPQNEQDEVISLREDVRTALRANAAVVNELMATKRELNRLRNSMSEVSSSPSPRLSRSEPSFEVRPSSVPPARQSRTSPELRPTSAAGERPLSERISLLGCACRRCFLLRRQGCPRRLLQLSVAASSQCLRIKDWVRLDDGRRGRVRYLGHVDTDLGSMDASAIWIGLELDEAGEGCADGKVGHKRYFSCRPGHALFAQLPAIAAVETAAPSTVYISDYI